MFKHLNVSFVLCIIAFIGTIECKKGKVEVPRRIMFTDMEDNINKNLIQMELGMYVEDDGIPKVDLEAELFEDIKEEIFVYVEFYKKDPKGKYTTLLFKQGPSSICEYLKNPKKEPILSMLLGSFKQFGNLEFTCPMLKGKFHLNGFFIDAKTLPSFFNSGDYKIDVAAFKGKDKDDSKLIMQLVVYLNVSNL